MSDNDEIREKFETYLRLLYEQVQLAENTPPSETRDAILKEVVRLSTLIGELYETMTSAHRDLRYKLLASGILPRVQAVTAIQKIH
jgi:hypothetical protein